MELTAHRPPQSEDISSVKRHYKKHPNSHIRGNGCPHTKPPNKSLHSNTCRKCGKKWPHKEALAQHKDACAGNVKNQTTSLRCVELGSSRNEAWDNKKSPGCQWRREWVKLQWWWIFILGWEQQIQNLHSACKIQQCQNQNDHWHGRLHWHTQWNCLRTHQSEEQHHTTTIIQTFACLRVHQPIGSKRARQLQSIISFQNRQCNTRLHVLEGKLGIVNLQVSHIHNHSLSQERWPWRNSKQQQSKTRPFSVFHG